MGAGVLQKCLSCEATKTPMWRNGPCGNKTLCNACGVRLYRQQSKVPKKVRAEGCLTVRSPRVYLKRQYQPEPCILVTHYNLCDLACIRTWHALSTLVVQLS